MAGFEEAVQALSRVPLAEFVAERKRMADALKKDGDTASAKQLLARKRPTISAWVVNQLYWHARDIFDALLATAEKLRDGDLKASGAHREAIAKLRQRAATLLKDAGNAPTESTLRRVSTTLSAIAVAGGFDPDPPGALAEDRDPPGFAAFGIASGSDEPAAPVAHPPKATEAAKHEHHAKAPAHATPPARDDQDHDLARARAKRDSAKLDRDREHEEREQAKTDKAAEKAREVAETAQRAADQAEKKREEVERKRAAAERHQIEAALRTAKGELQERERAVKQLEKQLAAAAKSVEDAQEIVDDLARRLDDLRES